MMQLQDVPVCAADPPCRKARHRLIMFPLEAIQTPRAFRSLRLAAAPRGDSLIAGDQVGVRLRGLRASLLHGRGSVT
ncbi:MAG: hypothetical protein EDS66_13380 [Planctomycetota bacterium]|nr:MAG: hypothetical protein EDS66_13380 [Planctomycetota bacterium]MCQ3921702.1 hypothetical protein [Planctomycetota bacterium]